MKEGHPTNPHGVAATHTLLTVLAFCSWACWGRYHTASQLLASNELVYGHTQAYPHVPSSWPY